MPIEASVLKEKVYEKSKDKDGKYTCQECGKKSESRYGFEIDHINPMNEGGLTEEKNLQILCRHCNRVKGDKIKGKKIDRILYTKASSIFLV